jgi:hypothetical protein
MQTKGETNANLNVQKAINTIVGRQTVLGDWLVDRINKGEIGDYPPADALRIIEVALRAHISTRDRMNLAKVSHETINLLTQEILSDEFDGLDEPIAKMSLMLIANRHIKTRSARRLAFRELQEGLTNIRKPELAKQGAEAFYLILAILEDREQSGQSMAN